MATLTLYEQADTAFKNKQFDIARKLLEEALDRQPTDETTLIALARTCAAARDPDATIKYLQRLIDISSQPLSFIDQLAKYCQSVGRIEVALAQYEAFLLRHPRSAIATYNYAYFLPHGQRYEESLANYQKALDLGIERPEEAHLNMANVYTRHLRDDDKARHHLEQALAINPAYTGAHYNLGHLAEQRGDRVLAQNHFQRCLDYNPRDSSAMARLADACDFSQGNDDLLKRVRRIAKSSTDPDIHFAMGRALEQRGQSKDALDHLQYANELDKASYPPYEREATARLFDQIIKALDSSWLSEHTTESSLAPVFICGMFRSGSTLVEQILAAHRAFIPAGEREFFHRLVAKQFPHFPYGVHALDQNSLPTWAAQYTDECRRIFGDSMDGVRITDKRPDNFLYLGLIKAMFPGAKIIVTRRDWRDVAWSIYANRLGRNQNYATDLAHIRHYIGQHDRLITHWQNVLGSDLHTVSYEQLIADPEPTITAMLESLDETFDENCLRFNELENTVRTASVWQVRQPLYSTSVGRWRAFEDLIPEVFADESET